MQIDHEIFSMVIDSSSIDSRRAVVSYKLKYVHRVLSNLRWSKLAQEKSVVRLSDRLDMTITVDHFDLLQAGLGETPPAEYGCQTYRHRYMAGSTGNDGVSPSFLKLCWCRGKMFCSLIRFVFPKITGRVVILLFAYH